MVGFDETNWLDVYREQWDKDAAIMPSDVLARHRLEYDMPKLDKLLNVYWKCRPSCLIHVWLAQQLGVSSAKDGCDANTRPTRTVSSDVDGRWGLSANPEEEQEDLHFEPSAALATDAALVFGYINESINYDGPEAPGDGAAAEYPPGVCAMSIQGSLLAQAEEEMTAGVSDEESAAGQSTIHIRHASLVRASKMLELLARRGFY